MRSSQIKKTDYTFSYNNIPVPYTVWSSQTANNIETVIFLGTLQIDNLAKWVAESCPPNSVVVQGAPFWYAKSDGSDIPEYMLDFTRCAFDTLVKNFPITKVHIVAESQAVPGVLQQLLENKNLNYAKRVSLIQPLGFNIHAYPGTAKQRIETFKRRIAANFLYQLTSLLLDKRLRYNHHLASKMGLAFRGQKAWAQYASGLKNNSIPNLKRLCALHKDVVIICGARDKIFPPSEIMNTLRNNDIDIPVQTIKGVPHSSLATRHGQKLLFAALHR